MRKFLGFTLAEVLITLGIIGVVAALTLPTLIQNYQKQVYVNQLKKAKSIIEQGFHLAMADDEVSSILDTTLFRSADDFDLFMNEFKKYFNVVKYKKFFDKEYELGYKKASGKYFTSGEGDDRDAIWLNDGTILFTDFNQYGGDLSIDVNGDKGPNQLGRDRFFFLLDKHGIIKPMSGDCNPQGDGVDDTNGCAARIIENGWVMDY